MTARMLMALLLLVWLVFPARAAVAGEAKDQLKSVVDEVLTVLSSTKAGDPNRLEKLHTAVSKVFDPEELARRTLAANWQSFSPEERARFTKAFVKLLENTYLRRIETYNNEQVVFLEESKLDDDRSEVSTKIVTSSREVPIVYRLIKKDSWKVYDVVIEGVSLVQNYRKQFSQLLAKETPDQLIARVEAMAHPS